MYRSIYQYLSVSAVLCIVVSLMTSRWRGNTNKHCDVQITMKYRLYFMKLLSLKSDFFLTYYIKNGGVGAQAIKNVIVMLFKNHSLNSKIVS
jgi:hypothetical protein